MTRLSTLTLLTLLSPLLGGCSALHLGKWMHHREQGPVNDMMCLWEPGEGRNLDNLPAHGFAGQLMFLRQGSDEPSPVDGDIRVYVFDDQGGPEDLAVPIHQFDFEAKAWNRYLRQTNLGPAYQIFLPYTRKGQHEARCALRVRFTPTDGGPPLYSKIANVTLPGSRTPAVDRWNPESAQLSAAEMKGHAVDRSLQLPPGSEPAKKPRDTSIRLASHQDDRAGGGRAQQLARLQQILTETLDESPTDPAEQQPDDSVDSVSTPRPAVQRYQLHKERESAAAKPTADRRHPLAPVEP